MRIFLIPILMFLQITLFAQNPINDDNWSIHREDNFNGSLNLKVKEENSTCKDWEGGGFNYYSTDYKMGRIISRDTFKYGYFETRFSATDLRYSTYNNNAYSLNAILWPVAPDSYDGDVNGVN